MKHSRRAVSIYPNNGLCPDTPGLVHFRLGNLDKAIDLQERAVCIEPRSNQMRNRFANSATPDRPRKESIR